MTDLNIPPPSPLVVDMASTSMYRTWEIWVENLESYFLAANVTDDKRKNSLLSYLGGEDLRKIQRTFVKKETFDETKALLETYFKPKENVTFERNKFHSTTQLPEEPIAPYITRLLDLARTCNFNNYNADQAVVDQVISKCHSTKLRRRLLRETDLKVDTLLNIAQGIEIADKQASVIEHHDNAPLSIHKLSTTDGHENYHNSYAGGTGNDVNAKIRDIEEQLNALRTQQSTNTNNYNPRGSSSSNITCYGCGETGHIHGLNSC